MTKRASGFHDAKIGKGDKIQHKGKQSGREKAALCQPWSPWVCTGLSVGGRRRDVGMKEGTG